MTQINGVGIYVDIYRRRKSWRWRAIHSGDNTVMCIGGKTFPTEAECLDAIFTLFADETTIYLRHPDNGVSVLRQADN